GNGQTPLAALASGLAVPTAGTLRLKGRAVGRADPRALVRDGVARVPEDRHEVGVIADMTVGENAVSERYAGPPFSRAGWLSGRTIRAYARDLIARFRVQAPGPDAPVRLLSGGNMQKLILARALTGEPDLILAHQPTRGLDVGAIAEVHRLLLEARARGAAILLISEDLDELLALADRIGVLYRGRLSPPEPAGELDLASLGLLMSGGSRDAHAA
ncbi:MAG TPA: ATP-binding cassette domain-containing protein, partial [Geminicoccaceae bacterium]